MLKTALTAAALVLASAQASAADMKLLVGGAMQEPFREVGAEFAKKNGHKLEFTVDTTGLLQKRLREGAKADIILLASPGMDALEKEHLIAAGTREMVRDYLLQFAQLADADELIVVPASPTLETRLRSIELLADAAGLRAAVA